MKSLVLLAWFRQNCDRGGAGVPYVMKADDDTYVNLERARDIAAGNRRPGDLLMGHRIIGRRNRRRPNRDPRDKKW